MLSPESTGVSRTTGGQADIAKKTADRSKAVSRSDSDENCFVGGEVQLLF